MGFDCGHSPAPTIGSPRPGAAGFDGGWPDATAGGNDDRRSTGARLMSSSYQSRARLRVLRLPACLSMKSGGEATAGAG